MSHTSDMQLNKLNYDRKREIVDFTLRRTLDDSAIVISGEVPLRIIDHAGLRVSAKAAVRQALLDAADALSEVDDEEPSQSE